MLIVRTESVVGDGVMGHQQEVNARIPGAPAENEIAPQPPVLVQFTVQLNDIAALGQAQRIKIIVKIRPQILARKTQVCRIAVSAHIMQPI